MDYFCGTHYLDVFFVFGEMPDGSVGAKVVEGDEGGVGETREVRVLEAGGVVVFAGGARVSEWNHLWVRWWDGLEGRVRGLRK